MKTSAHWSDWLILIGLAPLVLCGMVGWFAGSAIGHLLRNTQTDDCE